jgi:hypothetical protein
MGDRFKASLCFVIWWVMSKECATNSIGDLQCAFLCGGLYQDVMRFEFGACRTGVKSCRFCVTVDAVCHIISTGSGAVVRFERVPRVLWHRAVDTRGFVPGRRAVFVPLELELAVVEVRQIRKAMLVS